MVSEKLLKFFAFIYIVFNIFLGILLFVYQFFVVPATPYMLSAINESYYNLAQRINNADISPDQKVILLNSAKEIYQASYIRYAQVRPMSIYEFTIVELGLTVPPLIIYGLVFGKSDESEEKNHDD